MIIILSDATKNRADHKMGELDKSGVKNFCAIHIPPSSASHRDNEMKDIRIG